MSPAESSPAKRPPCVEVPDDAIVEILRKKTTAERVAMVFAAERTMRQMLVAHLQWRHSEWSTDQIAKEIARRWRLGSN